MVGWIASRLEWWVFWLAAADSKGLISREKVRAMYDGTLWVVLAEEMTRKRGYDVGAPKPAKPSSGRKKPPQKQQAGVTPAKPPPRSSAADGMPAPGVKKQS